MPSRIASSAGNCFRIAFYGGSMQTAQEMLQRVSFGIAPVGRVAEMIRFHECARIDWRVT